MRGELVREVLGVRVVQLVDEVGNVEVVACGPRGPARRLALWAGDWVQYWPLGVAQICDPLQQYDGCVVSLRVSSRFSNSLHSPPPAPPLRARTWKILSPTSSRKAAGYAGRAERTGVQFFHGNQFFHGERLDRASETPSCESSLELAGAELPDDSTSQLLCVVETRTR